MLAKAPSDPGVWQLKNGEQSRTPADNLNYLTEATVNKYANLDQAVDRNPSNDRCPGLTYTIGAGQTVYAQVVEYGDNTPVNSYAITFEPM